MLNLLNKLKGQIQQTDDHFEASKEQRDRFREIQESIVRGGSEKFTTDSLE